MDVVSNWALAGILSLHLAAIGCAWCTRVSAGTRYESAFQCLFLLALAAAGAATWYGHYVDFELGIPPGITLIGMVLLAVIDFRRTHEPIRPYSLAMNR